MRSLEQGRSRKAILEQLESRRVLSGSGRWVDYYPDAEVTHYGTVVDPSDPSNDVYQVIREAKRTARLDHVWAFNIPSATATRLAIEANTDAVDEVFHLAYSTNGGHTYQDMLAIDHTSDLEKTQTYALPANTNGEVFISVRDSKPNDRVANRLFVDRVVIQVNFQDQNDSPPETEPSDPEGTLPQAGIGTPIKILSMGDSVSSGVSSVDAERIEIPAREGYLPAFWNLLQSEFGPTPPVALIGTSTYNSGSLPASAAHSLYRGFSSYSYFPHRLAKVGSDPYGEINSSVRNADGWGTLRPNIALLWLGTNDVREGRRITSLETTLRQIITELRAGNSKVKVLLGTLPPFSSQFPNADRIPEANEMIRNLVHAEGSWQGSTASSPIYIVDHYAGQSGPAFRVDTHSDDGTHPNKAGEHLVAMNWLSVLKPILAGKVPTHPPIPTTSASDGQQRVTLAAIQEGVAESNDSTAHFVVSRQGDVSEDLVVHYDLIGTASPGSDYVQPSGTITIHAGTRDEDIEVHIQDDDREESSETLGIRLRSSKSYVVLSAASATLTIFDHQDVSPWPTVTLRHLDSRVAESDSSTIRFLVARDGNISEDLVIHYFMTGSASVGTDYVRPSGKIMIHAGTRDELIEIDILSDNRDEPNESVGVRLLSGSNYTLSSSFNAAVAIIDND